MQKEEEERQGNDDGERRMKIIRILDTHAHLSLDDAAGPLYIFMYVDPITNPSFGQSAL